MKKNIIKSLLAIACLLCSIGVYAHDFEVDGIYYNIFNETSKTVGVTYRGNSYDSYSNEYTGTIEIPESVTYNGTNYSVTWIGYAAFAECARLTEVTIPNSVTSIGRNAFEDCTGLTEVYITDLSAWCGIDFDGYYANPLNYAHNLYINNKLVTSLVIPDDITSIGSFAFAYFTGLTEVTIGNSVTSIGSYAFAYCTGLTEVTISNSVTEIGNYAFEGCTGLTEVTIGNSVTSIGHGTFYKCTGLTEVTIPNSVTSIGDDAFEDCTGLKRIEVEAENKVYDSRENCNAIIETASNTLITGCKNTVIPNSVTSIGDWAFYGCAGLTSITIPNSVTSIGGSAFKRCSGLTEITIPDSVTKIGGYAFALCTGLTEVTIPNSVTDIGNCAFEGCTGLTTVNFNAKNCTTMGSYSSPVFSDCSNLTTLNIGESVKTIPAYAFSGCTGLTTLNFNAENCTYMGSSSYPVFEGCTNLKTLNIGESVKIIPDYAFRKCSGLTSVTIPNSVTSIGEEAFYECTGLTEITIPNSVTSIGERAFLGCTGLTEVTIPNSVTSIGERAFLGCTGLTTLNFNAENCTMESSYYGVFSGCSNLIAVNIGESVKTIPDYAFRDCTGLKEVTIGNSVTSIGWSAFAYCTGLTEVTIGNSVNEIDNYAFRDCTGLTAIYCHTTTPPTIYDNTFSSYTASLYVPIKSRNAYKSASYWKKFTSINKYLVDGLYYNILSAIDVEVTYKNSCSGTINIPETIEVEGVTYNVTSIGAQAFFNCDGLKSITIPNSVTSIGSSVFSKCDSLKSITIPNSVTEIGKDAFRDCTGLTEVTIGNSVTSIGEYTFLNCTGLTEVTIGNSVTSIGKCAFLNCTGLTAIYCHTTTPPTIYDNTFSSYTASLYVPIKSMDAYKKANYWKNFTIDKITNFFVDGLYYDILSTTDVEVTHKDSNYNSYSGTINIPETIEVEGVTYHVTKVSASAFRNCTKLTEVTIPNSVTSIGDEAFYSCNGLTTITIPNSVTSIGVGAFRYCSGLTSVTIPNSVSSIGNGAFRDCTGLTEVTIPNNVTSIGDYAFDGCRKIREVTIPNSVISIGSSAFYNCEALRIVTIGNGVAEIGESAFDGCESIKTINSYAKVPPTIYSYTFNEYVNDNATLHVVNGCKDDYAGAKYWKYFLNITDDLTSTDFIVSESITLDQTNITAIAGETVVLTATIYPEDATEKGVVWSVSDATIATIEPLDNVSAKITVLREGVATITATTIDGSNLTATCEVTVEPTLATSITLDQTAVRLKATETATLTATILPESTTNKGVVWSSSDSDVASVENGVVTAHKVGTATITVTTTDGSNLTATCEVTVEPILATSITLDQTAVTLKATETATLTATVLPETTTDKGVVWTSSDSEVASVENGVVTTHKVGTATITATTTDGSNLTATCEVTVEATLATSITLDQTNITAIEGESIVLTATIYPDDATEKGVVWSVSDATIATIEPLDNVSAKITVLREGVATITATTIDGSNLCATCTIDVYSDIEALLRNSEDVEYYDLNGLRIENPTRGIYIVKQGDIVRKVFINKAQ